MAVESDRLPGLLRVLEVLWLAYDGDRQLQSGVDKDGEPITYRESAAPLAREIRAALAEIESVSKATPTQGSGLDELERKRAARQSNSQRRATPTRKRG
jgi:hypothetical protein